MPLSILRVSVALATLVWPAMASAAPGPISNLSASITSDGTGIYVNWNPPADQSSIAYYNVYFSSTSILRNGGAFDDVERTTGNKTQHILNNINSKEVYIAVLPVDTDGNEAEVFYEEVRVRFTQPASSSSSMAASESSAVSTSSISSVSSVSSASSVSSVRSISSVSSKSSSSVATSSVRSVSSSVRSSSSSSVILTPSGPLDSLESDDYFNEPEDTPPVILPRPPVTQRPLKAAAPTEMLELLSAQATSATGILLTFSDDVTPPAGDARLLFTVENSSGTVLPILRIDIVGSTVMLVTDVQVRNEVYRVRVSDALQGRSALTGETLPLNGQKSLLLFSGHSTGRDPQQTPSQETVADVTNLMIRYERDGKKYTVTATWDPSTSDNVTLYRIRQSQDGGMTWSAAQEVPATATSVRIAHVTPGQFSLLVQAVTADGIVSDGITWTVALPSTGKAPDLSDTGAGIALVLVGAGAVFGWRKARRK